MEHITNSLFALNQRDEGTEEEQSNRKGEKRCGWDD
jgi:hypothetical protein